MGVPDGSNGADLSGYAAETIEANLGDGTATALFLQGCGGDINPVLYKSVDLPRDGKPLGMRLGLSALAGIGYRKRDQAGLFMGIVGALLFTGLLMVYYVRFQA